MSCPTCDHTMHNIGCCLHSGLPFFWCPRCGTLKPCDSEAAEPALVARCRDFAREFEKACDEDHHAAAPCMEGAYRRSGIAESIKAPLPRSCDLCGQSCSEVSLHTVSGIETYVCPQCADLHNNCPWPERLPG